MARWLTLVLAVCGCDQAFSLDHVDPVEPTVHGMFVERWVENGATFEPAIAERALPPAELELRAILDDDTEVPVTHEEDGSFSFPIASFGQSYRLRLAFEDTTGEVQGSNARISLAHLIAGRPNRRPVTGATYVTFPYASARAAAISSTGIYTFTDTGMTASPVTWDWRLATPVGGAFGGMLDASAHDRIYALEYEFVAASSAASPQWQRIRALSESSISQAIGTTATLPMPMPVTPNKCIHITTASVAEKQRMLAATPRNYQGASGFWVAFDAPAPDWVALAGSLYAAICQYFTGVGLDIVDLDASPTFFDPYPGTVSIVQTGVALTVLLQLPGAASMSISNITYAFQPVPRGDAPCTEPPTLIEHHVGIVGDFSLEGVSLGSDNQDVSITPGRAPRLSWRQVAGGPIEYTTLNFYEVVAINGQTTTVFRESISVTGTDARLDSTLFEDRHTYIVLVSSQTGRPSAIDGDWVSVSPPFEVSSTWTHSFVAHVQ